MSFSSLSKALEGFFNKSLTTLPAEQQASIERDFSPWKWDSMTPSERRSIANARDLQNVPMTAADDQRVQKHFDDLATAESERDYWQSRADHSASDAAIRQDRLTPILKRLDELSAEHKVMRGDDGLNTQKKTPADKETSKQRRARLLVLHDGEVSSSGKCGALQRVTDREKLLNPKADRSNIGKQIILARKERTEQKRTGDWTNQLGQRP